MKLKSGIKSIDDELGSGIPPNAAVLIEYDEVEIAREICFSFIRENLTTAKDLYCGYFITDLSPYEIYIQMQNQIPRLNDIKERISFIDGHYGGLLLREALEKHEEEEPETLKINDLRNVLEVHDVFREVMMKWGHDSEEHQPSGPTKAIWVYDSLHTLLHFAGQEGATFIGHQMTAQKKHPYMGYFLVRKDTISPNLLAILEEWADLVWCLSRIKNGERIFEIKRVLGMADFPKTIKYDTIKHLGEINKDNKV